MRATLAFLQFLLVWFCVGFFFSKGKDSFRVLLGYACRILAHTHPPLRAKSWPRRGTTLCDSESLRPLATQWTTAATNASGAKRNSFGTYLLRQILLPAAPH